MYTVRYEWDEDKNVLNRRKHRVSFELAALVFEDEQCLVYKNRIDERTGEQRWIALGAAQPTPDIAALLLVAHVYREDQHEEQTIRIISARQAEKRDIRRYQAQTLDKR
jgi:uncharacterized DUF497 family protein